MLDDGSDLLRPGLSQSQRLYQVSILDLLRKASTSWHDLLAHRFDPHTIERLEAFLEQEYANSRTVFPQVEDFFAALQRTAFDDTRVVILGQDPYHGPGQAHGLSFSVNVGVSVPPSLRNIYKELHADLRISAPAHGCLNSWADQGILLLNNVLSVRKGEPASHAKWGWEHITDVIIAALNEREQNIAFVLWGARAQRKARSLNERHLVIRSAHPSPFSAHRGFLGSKPFSKINEFFARQPGNYFIDWSIPE